MYCLSPIVMAFLGPLFIEILQPSQITYLFFPKFLTFISMSKFVGIQGVKVLLRIFQVNPPFFLMCI